jgi:glycosyltransferase involved in cell wall biosynthesis
MHKLAIVIPAYKINFFYMALESIANQTDKNFVLYIGDDHSPQDLYGVVEKFKTRIDIIYHRFDTNMGGKDLVKQWERCIDLTRDEEWVWLFSDDDTMEPECVGNFYRTLESHPGFELYHFNVRKIDQFNNFTNVQFAQFPEVVTSSDFLKNKLKSGYYSTVVEYIFRKSHFLEMGRFQQFDLAWCSDDATWIKLGMRSGIRTIKGSMVYWRESQFNISTISDDTEIFRRKLESQMAFAEWLNELVIRKELTIDPQSFKQQLKDSFSRSMKYGIKSISIRHIISHLRRLYHILNLRQSPAPEISFFFFYKIYRFSVEFLKRSYLGLALKSTLLRD